MRALLMIALMTTAAVTWASEPSNPEAKPTAAEDVAASPADRAPADETKTAAIATEEESRPFKPPPGYRPKRLNGQQVYCTRMVVLGSRFPKEDCRTEGELRDLEQQKASMRSEMDQRLHVCSGTSYCYQN